MFCHGIVISAFSNGSNHIVITISHNNVRCKRNDKVVHENGFALAFGGDGGNTGGGNAPRTPPSVGDVTGSLVTSWAIRFRKVFGE